MLIIIGITSEEIKSFVIKKDTKKRFFEDWESLKVRLWSELIASKVSEVLME